MGMGTRNAKVVNMVQGLGVAQGISGRELLTRKPKTECSRLSRTHSVAAARRSNHTLISSEWQSTTQAWFG